MALYSRFNFYSGLFLVSASTLMLQLIQTRILSVVTWYHLAFFVISMAMFGLTAGAVYVYLHKDHFRKETLSYDLSYYTTLYALSIVICLAIQMTLVPVIVRSLVWIITWVEFALCISIPFYFAGIILSLALTRSPYSIGKVYGVDLLGAASGCFGVLLVLDLLDGPSGLILVGSISMLAAIFFRHSDIGGHRQIKPRFHFLIDRQVFLFLVLACFTVANNISKIKLQPLVSKGNFEDADTYIYKKWNTFSRIAVYPKVHDRPYLYGPSPMLDFENYFIEQYFMNIDGSAGTVIYPFDGDEKEIEFLKYDITNLAYFLPGRDQAAVIGIGGGRDILSAIFFGYTDITGVELNPIFAEILTQHPYFSEFNRIHEEQSVQIVVDDGRNWFTKVEKKFDVIQMSLIDTWAATGAGAFSLSENGLYTVEAWEIFLSRLTDNGVLTVSRWFNSTDTDETGRLVSLAVATLLESGVSRPRDHLFLATQGNIATLIVSLRPLSEQDLERLHTISEIYRHDVLISPTVIPELSGIKNIVESDSIQTLMEHTGNLNYDLSPPTDDRPFFFNQLPLSRVINALGLARDLLGYDTMGIGIRHGNRIATATLLVLFLISVILVLVAIILPLKPAVKDIGLKYTFGGGLYFLLIGFGFMLVEISLLQRMGIFFGHPIYSLSIILSSLILTTGLGSLISDVVRLDSLSKFLVWAGLTGGYILLLPFWLPGLLADCAGLTLFFKFLICMAVVSPAGIFMGFAFPTGIKLITRIDASPTPWYWGINGAASVLASVVAVATSIAQGISFTMSIGGICYLLLGPVIWIFFGKQMARHKTTPVP